MITLICQKCKSEFKVSGADFDERKNDGSFDLCPVCRNIKEPMSFDSPIITKPMMEKESKPMEKKKNEK